VKSYVPPNTLFGFDVFADGVTRLPATWVKLFRVTNLKSGRQMRTEPKANQLERIDLETLYGIAAGKRYKHFYNEIEGGPIDPKLLGHRCGSNMPFRMEKPASSNCGSTASRGFPV